MPRIMNTKSKSANVFMALKKRVVIQDAKSDWFK